MDEAGRWLSLPYGKQCAIRGSPYRERIAGAEGGRGWRMRRGGGFLFHIGNKSGRSGRLGTRLACRGSHGTFSCASARICSNAPEAAGSSNSGPGDLAAFQCLKDAPGLRGPVWSRHTNSLPMPAVLAKQQRGGTSPPGPARWNGDYSLIRAGRGNVVPSRYVSDSGSAAASPVAADATAHG